jgi:hypothetical protein
MVPVGKAGFAIVIPVKVSAASLNLPVPPVIVWFITTVDVPFGPGVDVPVKDV